MQTGKAQLEHVLGATLEIRTNKAQDQWQGILGVRACRVPRCFGGTGDSSEETQGRGVRGQLTGTFSFSLYTALSKGSQSLPNGGVADARRTN